MKRKRLQRILAVVVALACLASIASVWGMRLSLPSRSGRERLPGLRAPARVLFDARGVPHVYAATAEDAWSILGWLHAGDRFFQMELRRRAAAGRLSEIVGSAALDYDIEARRAGHARAALHDLPALAPGAAAVLDAYARGVNARLAASARPLELDVLDDHPETWSPLDSLAFARLMLAQLSEAPGARTSELTSSGVLRETDGTKVMPPGAEEEPAGSNAWVVAGSRAAHGKPIVANDPHLAPELPGVWYAAHLTADDGLDVAGLTLAGIPGVVVGRTPRYAWGITMAQVDDADVWFESIDPEQRTYARDGRALALESRSETIHVKNGADVTVRFYATDRGTLLGGFPGDAGAWTGVALGFAPDRAPPSLEAFLRVARADSAAEFDAAWDAYGGPAINVCWASVDGSIGHRLAGAIPSRRSPDRDARGGALEAWDGLVPAGELPRIVDPSDGFVASANDDWSASGLRLPYRGLYAPRDRVERIRELLTEAHGSGPAEMNGFQNDVLSRFALRFVERLATRSPSDRAAAEALNILKSWDGRVERTGPSRLFYAFLTDLARRAKVEGWGRFVDAFDAPQTAWDDPATPVLESRDEAVDAALASSLARVRAEDGSDPAQWNWGRAHTLRYDHPFSARVPIPWLRRFLDVGPIELPGESHTLNVQSFRLGREPRIRHIPSARIVIDLGDPDASTLVLPLGQSGQFQDAHYSDQVEAWSQGRTFLFPWTNAAIEREAVTREILDP